ncbi:uncharacterized protein LOC122393032 [Amphibalanus amphitrite]|uniref:uncharacterized protein LOC122393032 n=1 Tax=Amphibalanus amphitrite TaxID=1232801 RepID=UPI001C926A3E|nr:uncharacterized protein LOC122393032 [Amphibalanus amphitrite]
MLNQTNNHTALTMWTSTAPSHRDAMKYEGAFQRRIYWDLNKAIIMLVTLVTLVLGVAGNVLVLLTVCIRRLLHNPMSYYVAHLAVVHTLLSLVVCPFLTFHVLRDAHYRREVCASFYILLYSLALLVALGVLTIGVDRLWKGRWSWHYLSRHSGRLALAVVASCWVAALALVAALELTGSVRHPLRTHICSDDREGGVPSQRLTKAAPGDIAMEVVFYLCYGTAFVCLVLVQVLHGRRARRTGHLPGALTGDALVKVPEGEAAEVRAAGGRLTPRLGKRLFEDGDQEARSVRTLLLLIVLHSACWLPFYVVYSLNAHVSESLVPYNIVEIVHYLALLSSPLNPLLYYFSSVEFNMMMRQLLRNMCCRAASVSSGSTVTLQWEPLHAISDDQLEAFNADADRMSVSRLTPVPSAGLPRLMSDVGISVGSNLGQRSSMLLPLRELREVQDTGGPSAQLYGPNNLPPISPKRAHQRPSGASLLRVVDAAFGTDTPQQIAVGSSPSPVIVSPQTLAMTPPMTPSLSDAPSRGSRSPGVSPGASQRSSHSHGIINSLRNLFRRGRPGSRGRSDSSLTDSSAGTPERAGKRGFAARVAALWHRRRRRTGPGRSERTFSEESLVRRLVLAGLPSGVVAADRHRRLSGVWRSPGGRLHRLDPTSEDYPELLERIAACDSGYRSPAGQRIHHVCARHHVHGRCHHHDMRNQVAPPPEGARPQASRGNWTAERPEPVAQPARLLAPPDRAASSSGGSEGSEIVQRVSSPRVL